MAKKEQTSDDGWINVVAALCDKNREDRKKRIAEWITLAGPPHAEIFLGDDPQYMDRIGFWRVCGGIVRIRASKKGDFDPAEGTEIATQEIKAIIDTFGRCDGIGMG